MKSIAAVILAAGKGTRMKAPPTKNKVVYTLGDRPMIRHTLDTLQAVGLKTIIVVIGFAGESVRQALGNEVTYAVQDNPQGTGHALMVAMPHIPESIDTIISMYGDDSAFYKPALIEQLLEEHREHQTAVTLMTVRKQNPTGLGRIIRDTKGRVLEIVEEKNATIAQKAITEINTGLYCFDRKFLDSALSQLTKNPVSGEYYLTDVIGFASRQKRSIHAMTWSQDTVWLGVNTPEQLKEAEGRMKSKNAVK